jgi:erythromycin esterase
MGFDVIAFESSIYECFAANTAVTSTEMLSGSIFGVWATEEVLPLFDYIKEGRGILFCSLLVSNTMG